MTHAVKVMVKVMRRNSRNYGRQPGGNQDTER